MAEESLDSFLGATKQKNDTDASPNAENKAKDELSGTLNKINLEDEFTKLLNDFIDQDKQKNTTTEEKTITVTEPESLSDFISQPTGNVEENNQSLDSFVTDSENISQDEESLNSDDNEDSLDSLISNVVVPAPVTEEDPRELKQEEKELARAIENFQDGMNAIASKKNLKLPKTDYKEDQLKPNYKPSVGKKIAQYLLDCWDIINKYDPENMKKLAPDADDEAYLTFAEGLNDTYLQLVIISYVEILINIEICEVNYEQKKELIIKNRIKKELYEEYMELQERKNAFINKLKEKNFPIDADKLMNNYFRAAQKDDEGAFDALTKNPAMFSPIEFDKMHDRFFGLIKVTPEDGIKANQKIGNFIKKLKV